MSSTSLAVASSPLLLQSAMSPAATTPTLLGEWSRKKRKPSTETTTITTTITTTGLLSVPKNLLVSQCLLAFVSLKRTHKVAEILDPCSLQDLSTRSQTSENSSKAKVGEARGLQYRNRRAARWRLMIWRLMIATVPAEPVRSCVLSTSPPCFRGCPLAP